MKNLLVHGSAVLAACLALVARGSPISSETLSMVPTTTSFHDPNALPTSVPVHDTDAEDEKNENRNQSENENEDESDQEEDTTLTSSLYKSMTQSWYASGTLSDMPMPTFTDVPEPTDVLPGPTSIADADQDSSLVPTSSSSSSTMVRNVRAAASPAYLPAFDREFSTVHAPASVPTGPLTRGELEFNLEEYPEVWKVPSGDHPEIEAAVEAIDWSRVPEIEPRATNELGEVDMSEYDFEKDSDCWWTSTGCVEPKVDYLPADVHLCNNPGTWGLTFDDGPLNPHKARMIKVGRNNGGPDTDDDEDGETVDPYAEPRLYDYLAKYNQTATLFYVGSNVVSYPEAAVRAYQSGHGLCLHTWSHSAMTTLTNEQVVAELYWTLRAVKEATGVTSRCWRPPFGDVDDRVRAIAHQLGLVTVLWDADSQDWQLPSKTNNGTLTPDAVDGYFTNWIAARVSGNDTQHGHLGLEHELNEATIGVAEKWLPRLKEAFNVTQVHECTDIPEIYWELSKQPDKPNKEHEEQEDMEDKEGKEGKEDKEDKEDKEEKQEKEESEESEVEEEE